MTKRATIALVTAYVLTLAVATGQAEGAQRLAGGCGPQMFNSRICSPVRALQINPCSAKEIGETLQFLCGVESQPEVRRRGWMVVDGEKSDSVASSEDWSLSIWQALSTLLIPLLLLTLFLASFLRWRHTRSSVAALFCIAGLSVFAGQAVRYVSFMVPYIPGSTTIGTGQLVAWGITACLQILAGIAAGTGAVMAMAGLVREGHGDAHGSVCNES